MPATVREINGAELEQVISTGKVLVKFYSKTCGPCKMLKFVLNDVAKVVDDVEIVTIDFDENKDILEKYAVSSYPTMIVFKDGKEVERVKGLQQKPKIIQMLS
ncbi:thioredoxin family protein [Desulforamulus ferrireducens]|uniref:Thioredoxin n=1 Tax=Desulforamulus ferrireducens TaxID=1833852 RepID=A0A1S6ITL0_9FIRM|nr:thioredoxin domain-containing protein [Desulforamulus ferrireducens]AQS58119.1 thiol reductase thioredoxin [Desulforamulus ferrireducens]